MLDLQIEKLRQQYTNRYVIIPGAQPKYRRFRGRIGQVKTITMQGQALVGWVDSADRAWYAMELDALELLEEPAGKLPLQDQSQL